MLYLQQHVRELLSKKERDGYIGISIFPNGMSKLNRVSYAIRGLAADVRGVAVADTALLRGEVASAGPWYNRRICKESSHDLPIDRPATSQA